jgi:hypothetical protein
MVAHQKKASAGRTFPPITHFKTKTTQIARGNILNVRRVKHDADGGTEGLGREVVSELGTDDAGVSWSGQLLPVYTQVFIMAYRVVGSLCPR